MRLRREKTHKSWWARLLAQDKIRHGGGQVLVAQLKMRTYTGPNMLYLLCQPNHY